MTHFTRNETKIMELLKNGERVDRKVLRSILPDEQSVSPAYLPNYISRIRKKIVPRGYDIVCEYRKRKLWYRLVRLISSN